ncbi:MAG: hypothetical protein ACRDKA_00950 [Actinomycetota bacterium]
MTEVLVYGALFGSGLLLVLTAQPHGAPRASLARRVAELRPDVVVEHPGPEARVFRTRLFEELLRPPLERAGEVAARLLGRLGLDLRVTEERLRATGDRGGLALFWGQKLAGAVIGFAFLPVAGSLGAAPQTPAWLWLAGAAGGFLLPDAVLKSRAEARRRRMREDPPDDLGGPGFGPQPPLKLCPSSLFSWLEATRLPSMVQRRPSALRPRPGRLKVLVETVVGLRRPPSPACTFLDTATPMDGAPTTSSSAWRSARRLP